ncbi:MAG: zinc-binding dehydrogenase [Jiangellaceae bacterium]
MRALVFDPDAAHRLRLGEAPDPVPRDSEVLVEVHTVGLNLGELAFDAEREPGAVLGWDAAGVVIRSAPDGSGPKAGTRVVTFGWTGAWAELRAVDTSNVTAVPDTVDLGAASALPVAGVTALQALRRLGNVMGRRVLVTGASGGVGRFAVQLAARSGADVIASVGGPARGAELSRLGASEVVVGLHGVTGRLFGVLDTVGGPQLASALGMLDEDGTVQWIGRASRAPVTLEVQQVEQHRAWRLERFQVRTPFGIDLVYLVALLERAELDPQIGWRGPWSRTSEAVKAVLAREVSGKAVLDIRP